MGPFSNLVVLLVVSSIVVSGVISQNDRALMDASSSAPSTAADLVSATDAPGHEPATNAPRPESATDASGREPATNVPGPEPATNAPGPEPATNAPGPGSATDAPSLEPATDAPDPKPATDAPDPKPATDAPGLEPATDAPDPKAATDAPDPEPATDAPGPAPAHNPPPGAAAKDLFIKFEALDEMTDSFIKDDLEYLVVHDRLNFRSANLSCMENYRGNLAVLANYDLAKFIAEALSETRLSLDTVWTAGQKDQDKTNWYWIFAERRELINDSIKELMIESKGVVTTDRSCLGFGRSNHDDAQFRPLVCDAERSYMCQRTRGGAGDGNSTHPGWIPLGSRYYKIFNEFVDYDEAPIKCFEHDPESELAVVNTFEHAQQLGRYLLVGRPSLENAWVAAKWIDDEYRFEPEPITLPNVTDPATHFPPWRNNTIQKPGGCILLDRHLSDITLFVEARCQRQRAIICYKKSQNKSMDTNFADVIIENDGYRLEYTMKTWQDARDHCLVKYSNYSAILAELPSVVEKHNLLYVMGENRTAVVHIWLGGKMNDEHPGKWIWDSSNATIDTDGSIVDWVKNDTYTDTVEVGNTCLNMDRENHVVSLIYGTTCSYQQSFVCHFTADNLRALQAAEQALDRAQ